MFGKHTLPRMLLTTLVGIALLTAAVLVVSDVAKASMEAKPQASTKVEVPQAREPSRTAADRQDGQASTSAPPRLSTSAQARTVNYTYDDAGRLVAVDYGGGKIIVYTYDNAGNLLQRCALTVDFNPDRTVDVADVMEAANRWRCQSGDACYDADYDLDKDGDIDVVDIMLVVVHWGETCG